MDLLPLEVHVGVDEVVREDVALLQEIAVGVETFQGLAQRPADHGHALQFLGRQVVKVLVDRIAGVGLVLDAVEARHQHGGEGEIGVGRRVGVADLDPLAVGVAVSGMRHAAERLRAE